MATNALHLRSEIVTQVLSAKAAQVLLRAVELGLTVEPNSSFTEWTVRSEDWRKARLLVESGTAGPRASRISVLVKRSGNAPHSHKRVVTLAAAIEKLDRIAR